MYGLAITYGVVSLLLIVGFAYLTFKMTKYDQKRNLNRRSKEGNEEEI